MDDDERINAYADQGRGELPNRIGSIKRKDKPNPFFRVIIDHSYAALSILVLIKMNDDEFGMNNGGWEVPISH